MIGRRKAYSLPPISSRTGAHQSALISVCRRKFTWQIHGLNRKKKNQRQRLGAMLCLSATSESSSFKCQLSSTDSIHLVALIYFSAYSYRLQMAQNYRISTSCEGVLSPWSHERRCSPPWEPA
ncbi:hypothetical protein B0H12DRAFT_1142277 [Mycena haematopus]|nr:hypothetical protein B0H12DRAFT_1142277 [Mycena haematopus]